MRKLFIALVVLASMASAPVFAGPLAEAGAHMSAGGIPGR
jgi:hypothetical protein